MKYKEEDLKVGAQLRMNDGFIGIVNEVKTHSVIIQHSNSLWDYQKNRIVEVLSKKKEQDNTTTPSHYNNENGSLYLFAEQQKLNAWEFEVIKRIVRARKKGEFISDIEKTIDVLKIYLQEKGKEYAGQIEVLNK
jgi:hypothetical protein